MSERNRQEYDPYSNSYETPQRERIPHRKDYRPEWEEDEERERRREEKGRKAIKAGGTFWMDEAEEDEPITREQAEKWVRHMKGEDSKGEKWSMEDLKPVAQKNGIPIDGEKFLEFYVMMNAMYTDYGEVAKKYNVNNPDFYAALTKAWMNDKDAPEDKTKKYFERVIKN